MLLIMQIILFPFYSFIAYSEQYTEYDPFLTPADPSNPWISDDSTFWDLEIRYSVQSSTSQQKRIMKSSGDIT